MSAVDQIIKQLIKDEVESCDSIELLDFILKLLTAKKQTTNENI